jgi:hypothetical protein
MANTSGAIRAGKAFVEIFADSTKLAKDLKLAEKQVKAFGESIAAIGSKLVGLGGAITAPLLGAAKVFADTGSELNDMSARTGIAVESLSALSYAAHQSGSDMGTVEGAVRKMQKAITAGSEENQQAIATFASLGLNLEQLAQLDPAAQFDMIAKRLAAIHDPTAKAAAAMQIFGKSGTALLPMIDDLGELTAQAKEFGLVWTDEEAKKADALGDAFDLLKATLARVVTSIGSELAPLLTELAVTLARCAKIVIDFVQANGPLIVSAFKIGVAIAAAGAAFLALGAAIWGVGGALGVIASMISILTAGFTALLSPVGLLVAGLGALTVWFFKSTEAGKATLGALGEAFGSLLTTAQQTFGGIADALKAGDITLAAKVLWAGLKVEFLKGMNYLRGLWADWGVAIAEVFASGSYKLASIWINVLAVLKEEFLKLTAGLTGTWGDFVATMIKQLIPMGPVLAKVFGVDIDKALKDALGAVGLPGGGGPDPREMARVEQDRAASQAALKDQQAAETANRRDRAEAGKAAGAAALEAAQAELDALRKEAAQAAGAAKLPGLRGTPAREMPDLEPEAINKGMEQAQAKVDVAGSFSAAALAGMGAGSSIEKEQLTEQKKQTNELQKLNKKADVGALVFQ